MIVNTMLKLFHFMCLVFTLNLDAQFTNIGLFWSNREQMHGGNMEGGATCAIEKINKNNSILVNTTLRVFPHIGNCNNKRILAGTIKFVAPELMDLMIGDTCQNTTELGGLVASQYNIPFFDFGTRPQYLQDRNYGTLIRARGSASNIRFAYSHVCDYQNIRWTCLLAPLQIRANVEGTQQTYVAKINVTVRENFYYDLTKSDYPAIREMKISCRGM